MKRTALGLATAAIFSLMSPLPCLATYSTGVGNTVSFSSLTNVPLGTVANPNQVTATIAHAQPGTVLTIEVTAMVYAAPANSGLYALVYVPPATLALEPNFVAAQYCEAGGCTLTHTYWMDIDHAIDEGYLDSGWPLPVTVQVSEIHSAPAGASVNISLRARLEKK